MPTKPTAPATLVGLAASLASVPMTDSPRGGSESSFAGVTAGPPQAAPDGATGQFAGLGDLLEDDDATVFASVQADIDRQIPLANNRLACDTHWSFVASGYPWSTLKKDTGRDVYRHELPYGAKMVEPQAVPNKAWDLINKTAEILLVDFPEADAQPMDGSEEAQHAAELANHFLATDAGEQGTNDAQLWFDRVQRALFTSSTFLECWTDPTGGGYVPLQIKAHPAATDPLNPMVGPDGAPTTDYVLRYVAGEVQPDGTLAPGARFTDDPSEAPPQWRPRLRGAKWNREHIRVFPETARIEDAEKVIILGHCTLSEARRRWQAVRDMGENLTSLTDWTPRDYLPLLPPYMRGRWKVPDGKERERKGQSDERTMFYYRVYIKPSPDYPKGAAIVVSGINGGLVLERQLLAKPVTVTRNGQKLSEMRCMEIPVVQITPVLDVFDGDPQGRPFIELFAGAVENNAHLAMSFAELISNIVTTPWAVGATSPIDGEQIRSARATGDMLLISKPEDKPVPLQSPPLPNSFFEMYNLSDDAVNSIASLNRPAQGSDRQQEVSGRARQIAIEQNNVGNTSKQHTLASAYSRWCRIKIERAMADFSAPQLIAYEGEDGANKQAEWTGVDFALIGQVPIKAGTNTMMAADQKVQYLGNLQAAGLLPPDEAAEAARPSFAKRLGLAPNPHEQYVERAISAWLQGPPSPDWAMQYQVWRQAQDAFQQAMQQYQQQLQQYTALREAQAIAAGGPPPAMLGPEAQNDEAMIRYQEAVLMLQQAGGAVPAIPPVAPQPPQVPKPWTPFDPRPNDSEPAIAAIWARKLSNVISTVQWERWGKSVPAWRQILDDKYLAARQAVATATGAAPASAPQSRPVGTPEPQAPVQSPSFPGPRNPNTQPQSVQQKPTHPLPRAA